MSNRFSSLARAFSNPTYKLKVLGFIDLKFTGISMGIFLLIAALAVVSNALVFTTIFSICVEQLFGYHIEIWDFHNILAVWGLMILTSAFSSSD